ncbi:unnamed protein product [Microthlaspi erraticum]|uniref:Arabidopsis retrotransposon Orf1 C-terminal domain-containing protein n=1 Tax=Microthlaspi erraticum TaxID=1685480 RepID=A0A6D2JL64_9BRAS|nr:unnamed protein product [Microthlaspi erraticum]
MTNSEGSHASQREVIEGEETIASIAREAKLKRIADARRMDERMDEDDAGGYVYSDGKSSSESRMEERRTKKRNDPIESESEQRVQEEKNDSPSEEEGEETESEEEGEFEIGVNDQGEEGDDSPRGDEEENQDEPMEEAEEEKEEDELPMYQEHYNALFSMDFVETKHPHDDTMRDLGIFEDVELVLKNMQLGKFFSHRMESYKELTCEFLASMKHHEFDRLAWFIACSPNLSLDSPSKADKLTSFSSRPSVSRSFSTLTSALLRLKASATTLAFPGWY